MKRLLYFLSIFIASFLIALPVLAVYTAVVTGTNTTTTAYTMFPAQVPINTSALISGNYITSTGLDTRVQKGGTDLNYMLASDRLLFTDVMAASSSTTYSFTTGNAAAAQYQIITGYGGYVTRGDVASLEPGANYSIGVKGYYDTSGTALNKDAVYKQAAIRLFSPSASGVVAAEIPVFTLQENYTAAITTTTSLYGANWVAQTFATGADRRLAQVALLFSQVGTWPATGTVTISLKATVAGVPSGADLATVTVPGSSVGIGWNTFDLFYYLTNGATYALVARASDGSSADCLRWDGNNAYASGQRYGSTNSGSSWTGAAADAEFRLYTASMAVWGTVANGNHTITLADAGANATLTIDGAVPATTGTDASAAVPGNANGWEFARNGAMPYVDYITMSNASGGGPLTEELKYQPITYISGTTLPDRAAGSGTTYEDGTIVWGANPSGVSVSIGSLTGSGGTSTTPSTPVPGAGGIIGGSLTPDDSELTGTGLIWLYPILRDVGILTNTPLAVLWVFLVAVYVICAFAAAFKYMQNLWIASIAALIAIGSSVAMGIFAPWIIIVAVIIVVGLITLERSPSV